jgi:hypothetical protein
VKKYVVWGAIIGIMAGVAEAMVTALGAADYWLRVKLHWSQIGFAGWAFGAVGGYIIAKRIERRIHDRQAKGLCCNCGYNLTGNVSGRCPECGVEIKGAVRS